MTQARPPQKMEVLSEFLLSGDTELQLCRIVDGVRACVDNAERLYRDSTTLKRSGSRGSAAFLLTTAREEISKTYMLLDMCRLDPVKHRSAITRLCAAFYSHVGKYAYLHVHEAHQTLHDMSQVLSIWETSVKKWWPEPIDSGEPSMPHDTYFEREMPLYVDCNSWDPDWIRPDSGSAVFDMLSDNLRCSDLEHHISGWRVVENLGLMTVEAFKVVRETMSKMYFGERSTRVELLRILAKLETSLRCRARNSEPWQDLNLPLATWPLYHPVSKVL